MTYENKGSMAESQRIKGFLLMVVFVCAFSTAALFVNWVVDQVNLSANGEPDLNTLTYDELKHGLFVTGTSDVVFGPYAEKYMENEYGERDESYFSDYYYLLPIYAQGGDTIECFVTFKTDRYSDQKNLMQIVQSCGTQALIIEHGRMVSLDDEVKEILRSCVKAPGYYEGGSFLNYCIEHNLMGTSDKDEIMSRILTYSIYRTNHAGINPALIVCTAVTGLIFAMLLAAMNRKQRERMQAYLDEAATRERYGDDAEM